MICPVFEMFQKLHLPEMVNFPQNLNYYPGLIFSTLDELCELSQLLGTFGIIDLGGGL